MHMHHVVNNNYIIRIKAHIVRLVLNPQKDLKNLTWLQLICSVVKKATLKRGKRQKAPFTESGSEYVPGT